MKLIVDEMPKDATDCVFGTGNYGGCVIDNRKYCIDSSKCQYLKPITDCYAEDIIKIRDDGTHVARHMPITSNV